MNVLGSILGSNAAYSSGFLLSLPVYAGIVPLNNYFHFFLIS
jgi:hypothetical protein